MKSNRTIKLFSTAGIAFLLVIVLGVTEAARSERIKDIVDIQGVRGNTLTGVGLVIGLAGTGDSTLPAQRILSNILKRSGLVFTPDQLKSGNIAMVMVTALLGPFAREGSQIDVDVSSMGDAKSLQGGVLLPTLLEGLDGQIYAVTQAAGVSIGGWTASGDNASITKNHQAVGRIPGGAVVEREEIADFVVQMGGDRFIVLNLRNVDFSTSQRIRAAINGLYPNSAAVVDPGTIQVRIPPQISQGGIVGFVDTITSPQVKVDVPAVVVINERTGTIVVGENVGISQVGISQGSLVVNIKETAAVSQPTAPFSDSGTTAIVLETIIEVREKEGALIPVPRTVTVAELAKTLNAIGATPRDLIAIFNALKKAGALQARLEIM
ncbi:MAG TPA: flagellar basal body P-ring protein FlgI [Sedimentisphaerales bacterium]|nr:flagellar basal body P-ring protein FlgI [Sedimentisphaerales bacterium]